LFTAVRRAGPLSSLGGFALAILAVHLVEPQNPGLTPLAFLALGAAVASDRLSLDKRALSGMAVLAAAAGTGAVVLLIGAWHWERDLQVRTLHEAQESRRLLPPWPETAKLVAAEIQAHAGAGQQAAVSATRDARVWVARAVHDDPGDASSWTLLGQYDELLGDTQAARGAFHRALVLNPWSTTAMNGLGQVVARSGDEAQAKYWWDRSLLVVPGQPDVIQAEEGLRR
jgi:cytochrome c-type biogenesis protein CcmH/NrfG